MRQQNQHEETNETVVMGVTNIGHPRGWRKLHPRRKSLIGSAIAAGCIRLFSIIFTVLRSLVGAFQARRQLVLENLALRHQLTVLKRSSGKPAFRRADRLLWGCFCAPCGCAGRPRW